MLPHLLALMGFQLVGELIVAGLGVPFPGPLCGSILLLAWLQLSGGPSEDFARTGTALVDYLGLLFVPAGAAIVGFSALLLSEGLAIGAALVLSTGLAIFVSGLVGSALPASSPQPARE
jgi:holin-like protein